MDTSLPSGVHKLIDKESCDYPLIYLLVYTTAIMLWTIVVILAIMWLLGMVTSYTLGGLLHILLVVALVIAVVNLIRGRRVL